MARSWRKHFAPSSWIALKGTAMAQGARHQPTPHGAIMAQVGTGHSSMGAGMTLLSTWRGLDVTERVARLRSLAMGARLLAGGRQMRSLPR